MMTAPLLLLILLATANRRDNCLNNNKPPFISNHNNEGDEPSRWRRRTAKRRQRTENLLNSIEDDGQTLSPHLSSSSNSKYIPADPQFFFDVPTLKISPSATIDWNSLNPEVDPMQGGNLRQGTQRGFRKRAQVEAFHFVASSLLEAMKKDNYFFKRSDGVTIIDAGCGAGNLAIALASLLTTHNGANVNVLAVDVNAQALERLSQRAQSLLPHKTLQTCCADLADHDYILSKIAPNRDVIVVSLHACGAASDMAMNLAFQCDNSPFVICPCCTAKSLTKRHKSNVNYSESETLNPSASFQRSGATAEIDYPRSKWLKTKLVARTNHFKDEIRTNMDKKYALLAKVADIGLGPQTPSQQREHQRRAKKIVELDRLRGASERHGYDVRLMRIQGHDPLIYGKGELLLGAKRESIAGSTFMNLTPAAEKNR